MFGLITFRSYLFIGVLVAALFYAGHLLAQDALVGWLETQQNLAISAGLARPITQFITVPLISALNNPVGPAIAGIVWPGLFLWILLWVLQFLFAIIAPGFNQAADTIR